jgi:2'-5' RNA ligase
LTKVHTAAIVIIPPPDAWDPIQAIRRQHDAKMRRWMPHITLLYPFRPREELAAAAHALKTACQNQRAFRLRLARFRHFRESRTVWLAPESPAPLVTLQAALQAAFPDCDDVSRHAGGFTPHLSVGQGDEALRDALQETWTPLEFEVKEISIVRRNAPPDDVFRVEFAVPLGG